MSVLELKSPVNEGASGAPQARHVGIIMDGNGRWAGARGLSRSAGHRAGVEAARRAVRAARALGVETLTLYSFSTENWRRPAGEVRQLMGLLKEFIGADLPRLKEEGVRIKIIGARSDLSADILALIRRAEAATSENTGQLLQIAFNYGGRDEITRAARAVAKAVRRGEIDPDKIDETTFAGFLDTASLSDPDVIIRTSGEQRISNFMIWQAAYAEYVFTDVLWPDFDEQVFRDALKDFAERDRRFGGCQANKG